MESFLMSFVSMMVALALVIALAWVALRFMRGRLVPGPLKGGAAGGDDVVRFVRALPVGTKERVVLVEHRGERWLLGVTTGGISTIAHWPAASGTQSTPTQR